VLIRLLLNLRHLITAINYNGDYWCMIKYCVYQDSRLSYYSWTIHKLYFRFTNCKKWL